MRAGRAGDEQHRRHGERRIHGELLYRVQRRPDRIGQKRVGQRLIQLFAGEGRPLRSAQRRFHRQIGHVLSRRHDQRFRTDRVASHGGGDARRRGQRADHGHQRRDAGRTEVRRTFPRIHQGAGRPDACGVRRRDGDAGLLFPGRGALLPVHQRAEKRDADRDGGCRRLQADGAALWPRRGHEPARRAADGQRRLCL